MSDQEVDGVGVTASVAVSPQTPPGVLQALYHAVTGKTENYSKRLSGNVVIAHTDIVRLHDMILQRIQHYETVYPATVSVIIKDADEKKLTYSSWERFRFLEIGSMSVTSELILKFEFLIKLPSSNDPQRCIINIELDSDLPIVTAEDGISTNFISFFGSFSYKWRPVLISIEFVDFLVAKTFSSVVEEWFTQLDRVPESRAALFVAKHINTVQLFLLQSGRLGCATFLAGYLWFAGGLSKPTEFAYAVCVSLFLYATVQVGASIASRLIIKRVAMGILPAVIILTK